MRAFHPDLNSDWEVRRRGARATIVDHGTR
jgi:hypothetical protein